MKRTTLRTRAVITGADRRTGRYVPNALYTVTEDSSLWKAGRLRADHATRHRMHRESRRGFIGALAGAGRSFLMAIGLL